jgi:D-alanine-D-alanine ligase
LEKKINLVFLSLHGGMGENGAIQGLLEILDIPYTGSGILASALAMNKLKAKYVFEKNDIPTPSYFFIPAGCNLEEAIKEAANILALPYILKPITEGSSLGVKIIREKNEILPEFKKMREEFGDFLVERYIEGKDLTVGILETLPEKVLPILELRPKKEFYDYEAKYSEGMTEFIIPAEIPSSLAQKIQELAYRAHLALGCWGVSRVDFVVDPQNQAYVLEVNTLPGLTELSDLPAQAQAAGISYDELMVKILSSAKTKKW